MGLTQEVQLYNSNNPTSNERIPLLFYQRSDLHVIANMLIIMFVNNKVNEFLNHNERTVFVSRADFD